MAHDYLFIYLVNKRAWATCDGIINGCEGGFAISGGWLPVGLLATGSGTTIQRIWNGLDTGTVGGQGSHKALRFES